MQLKVLWIQLHVIKQDCSVTWYTLIKNVVKHNFCIKLTTGMRFKKRVGNQRFFLYIRYKVLRNRAKEIKSDTLNQSNSILFIV